MLNVIEYGKEEYDFPSLLVLGCFDAIHVGHRDLLKKAKLQAKINGLDLGVMLFRDGKGDKLVYSFEERLLLLEEFNVKFVLVIDYDDEFKKTSPLDFLHTVEEKINVKAYMSGKDFRFGAGAKGKSSTLKNYAEDEDNGVWYMSVKDVMFNDEKISTTLIKSYLENGDVAGANELLGSTFSVQGKVVTGAGRGEIQLGFPTVNIVYPEYKYPLKHGVYKVKSVIGETEYFGIANYGPRPTFEDERVVLEVHFAEFSGDLYGEILNIQFLGYIRKIIAFDAPEDLIAQLKMDMTALDADLLAKRQSEEETEAVERQEAESKPAAEEIAISATEFQQLDSGFDDEIVEEEATEEPAEAVEQPAGIVEEAAEEPAEAVEQTAEEEVEQSAEIVEEANGEDDVD